MIKIAYSELYVLDLPETHRFPMVKYELIKEQLLHEGTITNNQLVDPGLINEEIIVMTHDQAYWDKAKNLRLSPREIRKIGFPLSRKLINRSRSSAMGTLFAAREALKSGIGMNIAGGTHHAYTDRGEGFCLLNDIAISANYFIKEGLVDKVLVIDLDVHQGNGTAQIFEHNEKVFTWSIHCEVNYPMQKERSDLDIGLPMNTGDESYLQVLSETLNKLVEQEKPDFIFYQAGVDILATDKLGKMALTREGCKRRDETVLSTCYNQKIPVAVSMGGGYSQKLTDIVEAHCNTFRVAMNIWN